MDQSQRPSTIAPEYLHYAERHTLFELFQVIFSIHSSIFDFTPFPASSYGRLFVRSYVLNLTDSRENSFHLLNRCVLFLFEEMHFSVTRRPTEGSNHLLDRLSQEGCRRSVDYEMTCTSFVKLELSSTENHPSRSTVVRSTYGCAHAAEETQCSSHRTRGSPEQCTEQVQRSTTGQSNIGRHRQNERASSSLPSYARATSHRHCGRNCSKNA